MESTRWPEGRTAQRTVHPRAGRFALAATYDSKATIRPTRFALLPEAERQRREKAAPIEAASEGGVDPVNQIQHAAQAAPPRGARRKRPESVLPAGPKLAYSIPEAASLLGLSRSTVYGLLGARRLGSVLVGYRRLITAKQLDEFVDSLVAAP